MYKSVLCDLSGVVYQGQTLLPGAGSALNKLRSKGLALRFITNTTRKTKSDIVANLRAMGLTCEPDEVFAPAQAARTWLEHRACTPHLLVHPALEIEFDTGAASEMGAVVIGDAGEAFTYANLNRAFRVLNDGAPLLALADNRYFRDSDGALSLDAGPFVKALEFATGTTATVLGKPSREFFELALAATGSSLEQAVMIGDDAETDVAGALRAGVGAALLVRTGKYQSGDETRNDPSPTAIVDNLEAAAAWIVNAID